MYPYIWRFMQRPHFCLVPRDFYRSSPRFLACTRLGSGTICAGALDSSGSASNAGAMALLRKASNVQECGRWFFSVNSFSLRAKTQNDCRSQTWTHQDVDCQDFEVWNIKVQSCTDLEGNSAVFCIPRTSSKGKRKRTSPGFGSSLSTICIFYECIWGPWEAPLSGLHQELLERWDANHPRIRGFPATCLKQTSGFRLGLWMFVISSALGELISDFWWFLSSQAEYDSKTWNSWFGWHKKDRDGWEKWDKTGSEHVDEEDEAWVVCIRQRWGIDLSRGFFWWKRTPKFHSGRKSHGCWFSFF